MVDLSIVLVLIIFILAIIISYLIGNKIGKFKSDKNWEGEIENHRKDAVVRSRAVLSGQFSEQLAPYLPDFKYLPTETRFIGKPVDFIVFRGMDQKKN